MKTISCIIAAYNEETRIEKVLEVVSAHPQLTEIIVIDDGSTDLTSEIVRKFPKIKLLAKTQNQGKSKAVYEGIKNAHGELLLLLDADLEGLEQRHLELLIDPVLNGLADVTISLRKNSPWRFMGMDYISGERVFSKSILEDHLEKIPLLPNFALEVFMNDIKIDNKSRLKIVDWKEVGSPLKHKKYGFWRGLKGDLKMMRDIFKHKTVYGAARQVVKMHFLKVK
ncbi:MAG: glycosyltransferase [Candidatus Doudnabacteria bacterium]